MPPPHRDQFAQVTRELADRLIALLALCCGRGALKGSQDRQGPASQRNPLLAWDAQEIADHLDGDARGEVLDQIEPAQALQAPNEGVDQARDAGLEPA